MTAPLGMPSTAIGISSAAKTRPIFVAEPVVTSTNHGIASADSWDPTEETVSATSSARTARSRIMRLFAWPRERVEEQHDRLGIRRQLLGRPPILFQELDVVLGEAPHLFLRKSR